MKKIKKVILLLISIISLFQILSNYEEVNAATIGDTSYLQRAEKGFYSIQKWNGSEWIYVTYSITNYIDENGVKRVAYCVNPDLKGIGYISGEFEGYTVELKQLISNQKAWRVLTNGYPYKTPEQMGVESDQDAYLATKMALYAILRNQNESDIKSLYRAGKDKVQGENITDITRRGNKVIDTICNLVNIGNNGQETMQNNNLLRVEKVGDFIEEKTNSNYYSQTIKVHSEVECNEYQVKSISNFPSGTIITNDKGTEQNIFKGGEEFKIMVPKESIMEDIKGAVEIEGSCKNYPIFYAECTEGNYQNYLLCCDVYSKNIQAVGNIDLKAHKSTLQIEKLDKDTKNPITGVKFSVKYKDGTNIGTYITNDKGIINLDNLHQGQVTIKELETNKEYVLNEDEVQVDLMYGEKKNITIENEAKKGIINIIKVDSDNNKIRIKGAKFEIYNDNNELVETVVTDEYGKANTGRLPIKNKYIIKEVETAEEYILSSEEVTIELQENEIKTLTFKNKKREEKQIPQTVEDKLPRTGAVDIRNYLLVISLAGIILNKKIIKKE